MNTKPELLSPAGSPLALRAAVEGGADAVYMGMSSFNARIYAKNFTTEELRESIRLAHAYGTKVYIALNTMIYDRELDAFLRAAEEAYLCGADALIVADLGGAEAIRRRVPIELHASTQMAGHNADAARLLSSRGFSRMVAARELGREDLATLVRTSPIETEVFVHGALCVCHSGQCLFSSLVGGRSGNRGECAQPCRLPYRTGKGESYPLSLKDLSLAEHLPALCGMGVASLKIEGRMKSPEYVRDVTRIWRRLLDESRGATAAEMRELAEIFSRGGFTDGYYTGRIDRRMLGVRSQNDKDASRKLEPFVEITRKLPISLSATVRANEPMSLTVEPRGITVYGHVPEAARTAPIDEATVARSLSKWGGTPYEVASLAVSLDEGLMVPISALNALRRAALDALMADSARGEQDFFTVGESPTPASEQKTPWRTAVFYQSAQMPAEAADFFDICYIPIEQYEGQTNGVLLPPVIMDGEREQMRTLLARAERLGARHVLVGNLGHVALARETGMTLHGDLRLNVANAETVSALRALGFEDWMLSPELTLAQMRDLAAGASVIVYGRLPLMVTEKCVGKELGSCDTCHAGQTTLIDRRGAAFPVLRVPAHRSLILNSVPTYMADRSSELTRKGLIGHHFLFTTEDVRKIREVLKAYETGSAPSGTVRRIK